MTLVDTNAVDLGASTVSGALVLTASGGGVTAVGDYTIGGNFTINAGTDFDPSVQTITFNGAGPQTVATNDQPFFNVTKTGGSRLTVSSGSFTVNGTLVIEPGNEVDVTTQTFTINTLSNDGRFRLRGTQNPQTITNTDINSGITEYYGAGAATVRLPQFFDLEVTKTATTATLDADTTVHGNLAVSTGSLVLDGNDLTLSTVDGTGGDITNAGTIDASAAGSNITLGGNWTNTGTFTPGGGTNEVTFTRSTAGTGTAIIDGATTFHRLRYDLPGGTLAITDGTEITIPPTGRFRVNGAAGIGNEVTLTASPDPGGPPDPPSFPDPIGPTADARQWTLILEPGAALEIDHIEIRWSFAAFVIVLPPGTIGLYATTNWRADLPVFSARTLDTDDTGKINRIAVVTAGPLNYNFGVAPNEFRVVVQGYTVTGYTSDGPADEFHVLLEPQPFLDTGARPLWRIEQNNTLVDSATSTRIVLIDEMVPGLNTVEIDGQFWVLPDDAAAPVIGYTLAIPGRNQVFVHLSEPVPGAAFQYDGAPVPAASASGGVSDREYVLTLPSSLSITDVLSGPGVSAAGVDVEGNTLQPPRSTHRVSDLLLGIDGSHPIQPVFARDTTVQNPVTGEGLGIIRRFDGSEFLQVREVLLQAALATDLVGEEPDLFFDSNVPDRLTRSGMWLPDFDETLFSGLVPFPNNDGTSGPHEIAWTSTVGRLTEYVIPSSSNKIQDRSELQFFFLVDPAAANPLYAARVARPNASDWYRSVEPYKFELRNITTQRGGVTITNNVINPELGDVANLNYVLDSGGVITINVFNLAGDLIQNLQRGRQEAGEYSVTWDGRNRGGRIVSRGIYFIRVVGPDLDEYRKVMVVK